MDQVILVAPRADVVSTNRFVPWRDIVELLRRLSVRWMKRSEAETSRDWVQLIPVALIGDARRKRYCVMRRIGNTRHDLRRKLTLVIGGHVDCEGPDSRTLDLFRVLVDTLVRELNEEVGLTPDGALQPIGMATDLSSIGASRHVAVVFEARTSSDVTALALEEFSSRSKFSGKFLNARELLDQRRNLDPWSSIVFDDYICPMSSLRVNRQHAMALLLDE